VECCSLVLVTCLLILTHSGTCTPPMAPLPVERHPGPRLVCLRGCVCCSSPAPPHLLQATCNAGFGPDQTAGAPKLPCTDRGRWGTQTGACVPGKHMSLTKRGMLAKHVCLKQSSDKLLASIQHTLWFFWQVGLVDANSTVHAVVCGGHSLLLQPNGGQPNIPPGRCLEDASTARGPNCALSCSTVHACAPACAEYILKIHF